VGGVELRSTRGSCTGPRLPAGHARPRGTRPTPAMARVNEAVGPPVTLHGTSSQPSRTTRRAHTSGIVRACSRPGSSRRRPGLSAWLRRRSPRSAGRPTSALPPCVGCRPVGGRAGYPEAGHRPVFVKSYTGTSCGGVRIAGRATLATTRGDARPAGLPPRRLRTVDAPVARPWPLPPQTRGGRPSRAGTPLGAAPPESVCPSRPSLSCASAPASSISVRGNGTGHRLSDGFLRSSDRPNDPSWGPGPRLEAGAVLQEVEGRRPGSGKGPFEGLPSARGSSFQSAARCPPTPGGLSGQRQRVTRRVGTDGSAVPLPAPRPFLSQEMQDRLLPLE